MFLLVAARKVQALFVNYVLCERSTKQLCGQISKVVNLFWGQMEQSTHGKTGGSNCNCRQWNKPGAGKARFHVRVRVVVNKNINVCVFSGEVTSVMKLRGAYVAEQLSTHSMFC